MRQLIEATNLIGPLSETWSALKIYMCIHRKRQLKLHAIDYHKAD